MANIGASNFADYSGIPNTTVSWAGRSGTTRSGTIFTSVEKTPMSDTTETADNQGEVRAIRDRNDRIQFRFSIKPVGANAAAALAVLGDLPKRHTAVTMTSDAADTDISATGTNLVEEASTSYTPDGAGIINLTVMKHVGKTFSALS